MLWWPFRPLVESDLGPDQRKAAALALQDPYFATVTDATVPEFVLTQVKAVVDMKIASMRALEGKAAQIAGFGGTVIAIVGAFGRNASGWLLTTTVILLLISIAFNLRGMSIREDDLPSPSLYNTDTVAADPGNKARIAMALAESYTAYSLDLQHQAGLKARWVYWGSAIFLLGLLALVAIALAPAQTASANRQGGSAFHRQPQSAIL